MSYIFKRFEGNDITVTPFYSYKTWSFPYNSLVSSSLNRGITNHTSEYQYTTTESFDHYSQSGITSPAVWFSINKLYYKSFYNNSFFSFIQDPIHERRSIYQYVNVLSIPHTLFSEGIRPGSVEINYTDDVLGPITLIDDGNGNLYDPNRASTLDETYAQQRMPNGGIPTAHELEDGIVYHLEGIFDWAKFQDKKITAPVVNKGRQDFFTQLNNVRIGKERVGDDSTIPSVDVSKTVFQLDGDGYIEIGKYQLIEDGTTEHGDIEYMNPNTNDDFCISLWVNLPANQIDIVGSNLDNVIVNKGGKVPIPTRSSFLLQSDTYNATKFPYAIGIFNSNAGPLAGHIYASRADGLIHNGSNASILISTTTLNDGRWHHIAYNKSGSNLGLYIDGTPDITDIDPLTADCRNNNNITLGALPGIYAAASKFSGSIDQYRYYNRGLDGVEIRNLCRNPLNTKRVGNVIYKHGMIVMTHPEYRQGLDLSAANFDLTFQSMHLITELKASCTITDVDFNCTLNQSVQDPATERKGYVKAFATSSYFTPYITTIGMYNDNGELLAVGKLGQSVKKIPGTDITFIVKLDL